MEKFLNKKVYIRTILGGIDGSGKVYDGILTSFDEDYVYLDNNLCIVKKYILSITIEQ